MSSLADYISRICYEVYFENIKKKNVYPKLYKHFNYFKKIYTFGKVKQYLQ